MSLGTVWVLLWLLFAVTLLLGVLLLQSLNPQRGADERLRRMYEAHRPTRQRRMQQERRKIDVFFEGALSKQFQKRGWFNQPSLQLKLQQAGYTRTPQEHYAKKIATALAMSFVCLTFGTVLRLPPPLLIGAVVFAYFAPDIDLHRDIKKRRQQMLRELPIIMDLVAMTIEAGGSSDPLEALATAVGNTPGALHQEIREMVRDYQIGKNKTQVMREFAERVGLQPVKTLVSSILQADKVGLGYAEILVQQAEQLRAERRIRAMEAASALESKVNAPLVLSIIPVILIIVGVPMVFTMLEGFR